VGCRPTVGSKRGAFSCERGNPVGGLNLNFQLHPKLNLTSDVPRSRFFNWRFAAFAAGTGALGGAAAMLQIAYCKEADESKEAKVDQTLRCSPVGFQAAFEPFRSFLRGMASDRILDLIRFGSAALLKIAYCKESEEAKEAKVDQILHLRYEFRAEF